MAGHRGLEAWQRHRRRPSVRRRPKARFGWKNVPRLSGIWRGVSSRPAGSGFRLPLALGERLRTPNLVNLDDSLSWEDLPTQMQETQKQAGKQAGKQTTRQAVGAAILEGGLCAGVSGWKLMGTHSCTGRVGGGNGRSAAIKDRQQTEEEMGLETPAVRRCGQARPGA